MTTRCSGPVMSMLRITCCLLQKWSLVMWYGNKSYNGLCSKEAKDCARALFTSGWSHSEKHGYSIPGLSPEMMHLITEYAYTHSIPISKDNVKELLATADYLSVTGVVDACCVENCTGMTQLGRIIEKDNLNIKQEEILFEAILKWIAHTQEWKEYILVLLPKVRMGVMTADYFMNNVKNNPLIKDNEVCKPMINNGLSNTDFTNPLTRPHLPYGILLAIGGRHRGRFTNVIEAYDVRKDCWTNVTSNEESPRSFHGAAYLNGFVYCMGGTDGVDYLNTVRKFNPVSRTWHQVANMHSKRCCVSVCVVNNCIYAMGGFDDYFVFNTAERYEPENNQWTMIAPMHGERGDASATTLHNKVYICGGCNGYNYLLTAESYNTETNQWSLIAPMGIRRSGVGVIAYGKHIYAVGGFDGINFLRCAEAYNPLTNTWRAVHSMHYPRNNFGIEVVDALLFAVGGYTGRTITSKVECYDKNTDEWYEVHDMEIFRKGLSCCFVPGLSNITDYTASRDAPNQEPQL